MATYTELTQAGVSTRDAATLTGLPRSTATRRAATPVVPAARRVPANRLSPVERLEILAVLDAPKFVDLSPIQIWAQLLDEGIYLCSISTLYRILADHAQLVERRRIARHPARTVPELVATGPGQVYTWDIHLARRAEQMVSCTARARRSVRSARCSGSTRRRCSNAFDPLASRCGRRGCVGCSRPTRRS